MKESMEPRPCPFCGGEAKAMYSDVAAATTVWCSECAAQMKGRPGEGKAGAVERWNRRAGCGCHGAR